MPACLPSLPKKISKHHALFSIKEDVLARVSKDRDNEFLLGIDRENRTSFPSRVLPDVNMDFETSLARKLLKNEALPTRSKSSAVETIPPDAHLAL